jgi:putative ABC transport system permease protein
VRSALDQVDRDQSFFDVATLDGRMAKTLWQHRVATAVLSLFAGVALVLAVLGTYAVTAHAVAAERREIGIRRALGSPVSHLGRLVARQWIAPVAVGGVTGLGIGLVVARALTSTVGVPMSALGWPFLLPVGLTLAAAVASVIPLARLLRRAPLTDAIRAQ